MTDKITEYDLETAYEDGEKEGRREAGHEIVTRIRAWLELKNNDDRGYDLVQLLDRIERKI